MLVVDIFQRMNNEQKVVIRQKVPNELYKVVFEGENQDIPLEYLDSYLYNVKPISSEIIQLTIL